MSMFRKYPLLLGITFIIVYTISLAIYVDDLSIFPIVLYLSFLVFGAIGLVIWIARDEICAFLDAVGDEITELKSSWSRNKSKDE